MLSGNEGMLSDKTCSYSLGTFKTWSRWFAFYLIFFSGNIYKKKCFGGLKGGGVIRKHPNNTFSQTIIPTCVSITARHSLSQLQATSQVSQTEEGFKSFRRGPKRIIFFFCKFKSCINPSKYFSQNLKIWLTPFCKPKHL